MKSIGGYLGLELGKKQHDLLDNCYLFNSGRSACIYYLQTKKIKSLWVPNYICGDFLVSLRNSNIELCFYEVDANFEIKTKVASQEPILYVNYFGFKSRYIQSISATYKNLIIDNSQAIFDLEEMKVPAFYSPRKFFGVPDGGLLQVEEELPNPQLENDQSHKHAIHLLKQVDVGTELGYQDFRQNEERIVQSKMFAMSSLTKRMIESLDVTWIKEKRSSNFNYLHSKLQHLNTFQILETGLFCYPFRTKNAKDLRAYLIKNKVFTATLWADQLPFIENEIEKEHIVSLVHLPIDQRYGVAEMDRLALLIQDFYD